MREIREIAGREMHENFLLSLSPPLLGPHTHIPHSEGFFCVSPSLPNLSLFLATVPASSVLLSPFLFGAYSVLSLLPLEKTLL